MWLSERRRGAERETGGAEVGVVTLEGERVGVYLSGERRDLPVLGPGGYCWRPSLGEKVLVLKTGEDGEQPWVAGADCRPGEELGPGDVGIYAGNAAVVLKSDGAVDLRGQVKLNGVLMEELFAPLVKEES